MKTFQDFLQDQHLHEAEGLRDFLKHHGLEDEWKAFKNKPKPIITPPDEPKGWELQADEIMRDLNRIVSETIDHSPKINRFGIDEIKFEIINKEKNSRTVQFKMEAEGITTARNEDHIRAQLRQIADVLQEPLSAKGLHLTILYNQLDVSEAVEEAVAGDETPMGLAQKYNFKVMCVLVSNPDKHKQPIED